jgi:DNA-binding CsgD family transcriptional regulator
MTTLSNRELSALIGSIYDCALDPQRWDHTLLDVANVLECEHVILSLNDIEFDRILINRSTGWEPYWLEQRNKHLPEIHSKLTPWLLRQTSLDQPFVGSVEIPASQVESSAYVRECLQPLGIIDIAHYFLVSTSAHFSELVLAKQNQRGIFTKHEIEDGMLLLPHLRRAVTISNVLDVRTVERDRMAETLDALRNAVILISERGAILHANRTADDMLLNRHPIMSSGGSLIATSRFANNELQKAIKLASRDESKLGRTGISIRLTETSPHPMFAHVLPLTGGDVRTSLHPAAVAAIFIDTNSNDKHAAITFAAAFKLTPAETRVTNCLLSGRTLAGTAEELGIAMTTVKTHLNNIFQKTGVRRQSELMRLAALATPPVQMRSLQQTD